MAGILFSYTNPNNNTKMSLPLRLPPTSIQWSYSLNTNKIDTYGGQVIQVLSINWNQLTLQGRFGKEGPHGRILNSDNTITGRKASDYWNYNSNNLYAIGLSQMTAFFQQYFAQASQGFDRKLTGAGNYDQVPMTVSYVGGLDAQEGSWNVYPISFPSYSRSNEEFAPQWQVTFEIEEADYAVNYSVMIKELDSLQPGVGYIPYNMYSDPLGQFLTTDQSRTQTAISLAAQLYNSALDVTVDHFYNNFLPNATSNDYAQMLLNGGSIPNVTSDQLSKIQQQINSSAGVINQTGVIGGK